MKIVVFDCEVFAHDWLFVFKAMNGEVLCVSHNNNDEVIQFISATEDMCLVGFNNKHYDNFILSAVINRATPEQIKDINDFIIVQQQNGWEHPFIQANKIYFDNFDLMDDMQQGISLKSIEAHLGMNIEETEVDFNVQRALTDEEIERTIRYCTFDVEATEKLLLLRKDYLTNKLTLGRSKGLSDTKSLYMTNAKLTSKYLDAVMTEHDDEREYAYPKNLLREYIPQEVFAFFDRLHDKSISDEELFSSNYDFKIGDCECNIAFGGIHGAIPTYREKATDNRSIRNRDVASYYPHEMTLDGYCSRNIPDPKIYADMLETRMRAKKSGDTATANALKLVANTTYGAMLNPYNDLYDPLMGRSVCITGQLRLLELTNHLVAECPSLKVIQLNTDGIMVSLDNSDIDTYNTICDEWQKRTGFELEEDCISEIVQKDVNNYIEIPIGDLLDKNGKPHWKIKGGLLVRGIPKAGAFNINNNAIIVAEAIINYFVYDKPAEDTINECDDLFKYQLIAKASGKYSRTYQLIEGNEVAVQRCNRVYAAKDKHYGTIYKVHSTTGVAAKISGLPVHCVVDNKNELTIDHIDKTWYIALAQKYINDFVGIPRKKPDKRKITSIKKKINKILEESKMATKQTKAEPTAPVANADIREMSVWEKLLLSRYEFAMGGVKKTGLHLKPNYKYFTLADIVPASIPIFVKYRLLVATTFTPTEGIATVYNIDRPDEKIVFTTPLKEIEAIESSATGTKLTNPMQDMGSVETFARRYLYLVVLDVVEHDSLDGNADEDDDGKPVITLTDSTPEQPKHAPATAADRKAIVETLTATDSAATPEQLEALKNACIRWREIDPSSEESLQKIALETDGFTTTTKETCEALLINIGNAISIIENGTEVQQ